MPTLTLTPTSVSSRTVLSADRFKVQPEFEKTIYNTLRETNGFHELVITNVPPGWEDFLWEVEEDLPYSPSKDGSKADTFRAESITSVDQQNERFVRNHHPTLSSKKRVWVSESGFGEAVWLVDSPITGSEGVYAGGRPIHYYPWDYWEYIPTGILTPRSPGKYNQHFDRYINPRRLLRPTDLDSLRELFPEAVGVEVLIAGFIVVLFKHVQYVHHAYTQIWPLELAGLRVYFDVARYQLTTTPIESGLGVSADVGGQHDTRAGCLGLKVQLQNGSCAITTVTHGFVHCPGDSTPANMMHLFRMMVDKAKKSLMRYLPVKFGDSDGPFIVPKGVLTNSPVGRDAWLALNNRKLGTITRTYDQPSYIKPYPAGYSHDLSLISDPALPDLVSPPGYPSITGWADYSAALDGQEVYVVCHQTNVGRWRMIKGNLDSTLFTRAAVLGTGYTWNREDKSQNAFLLWHTGAEYAPADGWPGAPLCLGRPSDTAAKAVVFQNFQRPCLLVSQPEVEKQDAMIKAGFLLPQDIKNSTILSGEIENPNKPFNTLPAANWNLGELESQRRSFSAI
ncbi:hypothetical protein BDV32DRAFT_149988 [Aspergillus pseudonomiae]|nr:hypothetical protein BDV32DRAFT_149988 [Aspergillus pseudonomiae]